MAKVSVCQSPQVISKAPEQNLYIRMYKDTIKKHKCFIFIYTQIFQISYKIMKNIQKTLEEKKIVYSPKRN